MKSAPVSAGIAFVLILAASPSGIAEDCAGLNQAMKKDGNYHFTYESWVQKNKKGDTFLFGRCAQTKNGADVFIDWKKAGVSGYAREGAPLHNEISWPTKDCNGSA